ncbi:MAG: endonuclease MutS2 [Anaerolineales bacterium]|nr:endonuclease MutS2 [Anaerolineales bacterium]
MDAKSLATLELAKILDRLSKYTAFSASMALALALTPTTDLREAQRRQAQTTEARRLLSIKPDLTIGGARDVRPQAQSAAIGGVLEPNEMLDVKNTLIAGRTMQRTLLRLADQFPSLAALAARLAETPGLVEAISQTLDERGEVLDSASPELTTIRHDLRLAHDRLLQKLQRILGDPKNTPYLQEALITQRDGRYVIPLKADFKGRIRGIVHDQSASGATVFIEPLSTVELNNTWRELKLAEAQEIRRIMAALSALVGQQAARIIAIVDTLAEIDLAFAKARYADTLRAHEPLLREFRKVSAEAERAAAGTRRHPGSTLKLLQARHPLINPDHVVPIDVALDDATYALVITGPNTGGKTVSLKTVGLLALMAQCGLHLPAGSGSELSVFPRIYADIGDEQSIEQSLSTFSAHITNTIRILRRADDRSLIILDELGAGTDPAEGSALARAMLSYLLDMGATTLVATHYPELKGYAYTTPGVRNASMEFDLDTLAPTYRLIIGLPGRSNAFAIAARLGLDATIIDEAKQLVGQADLESEKLLEEIHQARVEVRAERTRAENARRDAEETERELALRLEQIEDERRNVLEQARRTAAQELDGLRDELSELKRKLARAAALGQPGRASAGDDTDETPGDLLDAVDTGLAKTERAHAAPVAARPIDTGRGAPARRAIRLGDTVKLKHLNSIGVVTALTAAEAEVQVGRMRIRAKLDEIVLRASPEEDILAATRPAPAPDAAPKIGLHPSPGLELDLRGQIVEDALSEVERYLDAAYLAGLPWVRLIHGKGTGKLRQAVREYLRASPVVKSHETGQEAEGGDGVTVVKLALAAD